MPRRITDYAMMVQDDMDPEEEGPISEEMLGFALAARDSSDYSPPSQDYNDQNPYGEGGHGSWVDSGIPLFDGMAGGKFELEIVDDEDSAIEDRDDMIDEDVALSARSMGYQRRAAMEDEEY